mmetsp:Transcript_29774/g.79132  ORF Transcript_29774/g.79132 Transcript_29774/m.79132 type:complete len:244 (+) Transcript_29774:226-957(+)
MPFASLSPFLTDLCLLPSRSRSRCRRCGVGGGGSSILSKAVLLTESGSRKNASRTWCALRKNGLRRASVSPLLSGGNLCRCFATSHRQGKNRSRDALKPDTSSGSGCEVSNCNMCPKSYIPQKVTHGGSPGRPGPPSSGGRSLKPLAPQKVIHLTSSFKTNPELISNSPNACVSIPCEWCFAKSSPRECRKPSMDSCANKSLPALKLKLNLHVEMPFGRFPFESEKVRPIWITLVRSTLHFSV